MDEVTDGVPVFASVSSFARDALRYLVDSARFASLRRGILAIRRDERFPVRQATVVSFLINEEVDGVVVLFEFEKTG